ncbi:uncharacterized protein LOC113870340 [Abrus precatorius]|uniref:Uncharacterized protein LOC113870340 n=1 Tax=Abrus precatorius TaxID=3816 RepID=A0A8B8M6I0_ABRPR|nr:uncharacterized protein LOC113870340 [Abrus precatorius]
MVLRGLSEDRGAKSMATTPNRFHNFSLPFLKWGKQRKMRCATAESSVGGDRRSPGSNSDESTAKMELEPASDAKRRFVDIDDEDDDDDGIAAVRQKLILDLKTEADRMKDAILRNEEKEEDAVVPWNLRKRRANCAASVAAAGDRKGLKIDEEKRRCSLPKLRSGSDTTEMVKLCVSLSRKEIEEDFVEILGRKPRRRPNKRPRVVQKQLDTLFPGLWLTEITADLYNVLEAAENGKAHHSRRKKICLI